MLASGLGCSWPQTKDSLPTVPFSIFGCHIAKYLDTLQFILVFTVHWNNWKKKSQDESNHMWKNSKKEWRYKFLPKNPGKKIQKILPNTTSLCTSQWHCTPFNLFPFLHYKYSSQYYIMLIYFFSTGLLIRYWVLVKNRLFFLYAVSIDLLLFAPA